MEGMCSLISVTGTELIWNYSDAFTKREKGNEDYYIKQQEREK